MSERRRDHAAEDQLLEHWEQEALSSSVMLRWCRTPNLLLALHHLGVFQEEELSSLLRVGGSFAFRSRAGGAW